MGLLYKASPDGCQHRFTNPAEAKALPCEQASALVFTGIRSSLHHARQTQLPQELGTSGTCQIFGQPGTILGFSLS